MSHFTFGIYDWAFLYSLNYKSIFSPPQALMTMLHVVRLINLHTISKNELLPLQSLYKDQDVESTMSEHMICFNSTQMSRNEGRALGSR